MQLALTMAGATGTELRYQNDDDQPNSPGTAYTYDPQGSLVQPVTLYFNGSGGPSSLRVRTSSYDGFGLGYTATADGSGREDPAVGFGGQWGYYRDYTTGLYLLTHRYYDAGAGRFVTRDPIGYKGGINLYGFVGNNPVNNSDPSGYILVPPTDHLAQYNQAIEHLKTFPLAKKVIDGLNNSKTKYFITIIKQDLARDTRGPYFNQNIKTIGWDPYASMVVTPAGNGSISPALLLGHELDHAYHYDTDSKKYFDLLKAKTNNDWDDKEEARTITYFENPAAQFFGEGVRHNHRERMPWVHVNSPLERAP